MLFGDYQKAKSCYYFLRRNCSYYCYKDIGVCFPDLFSICTGCKYVVNNSNCLVFFFFVSCLLLRGHPWDITMTWRMTAGICSFGKLSRKQRELVAVHNNQHSMCAVGCNPRDLGKNLGSTVHWAPSKKSYSKLDDGEQQTVVFFSRTNYVDGTK